MRSLATEGDVEFLRGPRLGTFELAGTGTVPKNAPYPIENKSIFY